MPLDFTTTNLARGLHIDKSLLRNVAYDTEAAELLARGGSLSAYFWVGHERLLRTTRPGDLVLPELLPFSTGHRGGRDERHTRCVDGEPSQNSNSA